MELKQIAHIETPYATKFGVPRQAGLAAGRARVVFEPEYRVAEAVRGLEGFDYVWLLWGFHLNGRQQWSPTVRPPRLGGNKRVGVFATRSPYRPNAVGLSSVRLVAVENDPHEGMVLVVEGADLVDGTPIYDVKPYIAYADSHPDARSGFAPQAAEQLLHVECPEALLMLMPEELRGSLLDILAHDPRPQYHHDPERVYCMELAGKEIRFKVEDGSAVVTDITPRR